MVLRFLLLLCANAILVQCNTTNQSVVFHSDWPTSTRVWIGPEYWANPMQDWQLNNGRMECVTSGGDRNVFLLTHELDSITGDLKTQVTLGPLEETRSEGWVGFKIGVKGEFQDYRDSAVRGEGLPVGITDKGTLFIGSLDPEAPSINLDKSSITMILSASPNDNNTYQLKLEVFNENKELLASHTQDQVAAHWITGGLSLVCSASAPLEVDEKRAYIEYPDWGTEANTERNGNFRFWFSDWQITGSKVKYHPERSFGPVLFTQFTVSKNQLKLTAQMPPIGESDSKQVTLELKNNNQWEAISTAPIDKLSKTATFKHQLEPGHEATSYRVHYTLSSSSDEAQDVYFNGTIPKEPVDKQQVVVAAFTGNNDLGFPNNDLVRSVTLQKPDFLFFSGDQIYEGVAGYGVQRSPLEKASLDYLRKWYLFGWTYRELLGNLPSVAIPDDHDVYHGNIWGEAGKPADTVGTQSDQQDTGGYKMFPDWVNMVQQTQTSHLPDPYDSTPVLQGIGVYYTNLEYAGLSFGIIEDRKFKSAPKGLLTGAAVNNGWAQNPAFDMLNQSDHPHAVLLGERQHNFLNWWTENWEQEAWMKVLLSQTIFANVATLPREDSMHDRIVPQLRVLEEGEYAPDDVAVTDMDSNGWPQTGRDNAVRIIRKAFTFHLAGDQHLGSTIQYGVDNYQDGGFALCVPSVSNVWPRRWYPPVNPATQSYTGDFKDGFGNLMTVLAVSNPVFTGRKPAKLYDRATGYGIARFNRSNREISIENWPRDADPSKDRPYHGWPITIHQKDNFSPLDGAYLPLINFEGEGEPLLQALSPAGEVIWTIRVFESSTDLKVPKAGNYLIKASLNDIEKEFKVSATNEIQQRGELTLEL